MDEEEAILDGRSVGHCPPDPSAQNLGEEGAETVTRCKQPDSQSISGAVHEEVCVLTE